MTSRRTDDLDRELLWGTNKLTDQPLTVEDWRVVHLAYSAFMATVRTVVRQAQERKSMTDRWSLIVGPTATALLRDGGSVCWIRGRDHAKWAAEIVGRMNDHECLVQIRGIDAIMLRNFARDRSLLSPEREAVDRIDAEIRRVVNAHAAVQLEPE